MKETLNASGEVTARRYSGELTEELRQDVRAVILEASAREHTSQGRGREAAAVGGLLIGLAVWGAWALNGRQDPRIARASVAFSSANGIRGSRVGAEELLPVRGAWSQPARITDGSPGADSSGWSSTKGWNKLRAYAQEGRDQGERAGPELAALLDLRSGAIRGVGDSLRCGARRASRCSGA
jgi:hypothetical protein